MSEPIPTTDEAMDVIANHKGYYVAMAQFVAVAIANGVEPWLTLGRTDGVGTPILTERGTVHSYAVRMAMTRAGVMAGYVGKYHFMGTAMKAQYFTKTGRRFNYSHVDENTSAHGCSAGIWKIRPGAGAGAVLEPLMPAHIRKRVDDDKAAERAVQEAHAKAVGGR